MYSHDPDAAGVRVHQGPSGQARNRTAQQRERLFCAVLDADILHYSGNESVQTPATVSGVISRGPTPVPPVVNTMSMPASLAAISCYVELRGIVRHEDHVNLRLPCRAGEKPFQ